MGRQYEYIFANPSDYHGLLSHYTGQCADSLAEERIRKFQIADCGL
jgi:hypothetical protein